MAVWGVASVVVIVVDGLTRLAVVSKWFEIELSMSNGVVVVVDVVV